jgi:hypothetical protein
MPRIRDTALAQTAGSSGSTCPCTVQNHSAFFCAGVSAWNNPNETAFAPIKAAVSIRRWL